MWGWIIGAATWIWNAFQGVADASLALLWTIVSSLGTAIKLAAVSLWKVGTDIWDFTGNAWHNVVGPLIERVGKDLWISLKAIYTDVLKPAWTKFNRLVTRLHTWLQTKFAPILKWLTKARAYIQKLYDRVVRPILDIIDVAKQGLNILAALGVSWAKQLEQDLSALEARIEAPFQYVLSKLNELIGWIDKIIDLDGLFQRLTLLNSLVRDAEGQWRILMNSVPIGDAQTRTDAYHAATHGKKYAAATQDTYDYLESGSGADAGLLDEVGTSWAAYLTGEG